MTDLRGAQGALVGDHSTQTNIFATTVTVSTPVHLAWPVSVGVIPLMASCYQERGEAQLLSDAFADAGTAAAAHVLSGLGGVGKTQLAAAHLRSRTDVDLRVWVNASSRAAVLSGYAQAAAQLGYLVVGEAEQAAQWFLAWLQAETDRSWSIVLDDLTDPADLRGLWPDGPRGQTVVTTRRTDAALTGLGRRRVEVGLFTSDQARHYLAEKLDADPESERMREADQLAADLGHLPLAQAGTFILDRGDTCARYRARLTHRRSLAQAIPADALADDYRATVAATWSISIEAADALHPVGLARPVLELLSVLDPSGIPTDLPTGAAVVPYASATGPRPPRSPPARDTDRLRVLGPDHPHTLSTRGNLANLRGKAGDLAGAAAAYEQLLADRLRVLGPDHPDTRSTRKALLYWRSPAAQLHNGWKPWLRRRLRRTPGR